MTFWRCFYHVVWTTKNRLPLITPQNEPLIFDIAQAKTQNYDGQLLAINSVADHVHIAAMMPPKVAISDWVKSIKGVTSYEINNRNTHNLEPFRWQEGFGVLTFGAKNVPMVTAYIENQKVHHAENNILPYLEQTD